eukprot:6285-Heterococcus_DN1.PRE.1
MAFVHVSTVSTLTAAAFTAHVLYKQGCLELLATQTIQVWALLRLYWQCGGSRFPRKAENPSKKSEK